MEGCKVAWNHLKGNCHCVLFIQLCLFITCRLLVRSSDHYLHVVMPSAPLCGNSTDSVEEVVKAVAKEMCVEDFKPAQLNDLENELLRIDEVHISELITDFSHSKENASQLHVQYLTLYVGRNLGSPHQSIEGCKTGAQKICFKQAPSSNVPTLTSQEDVDACISISLSTETCFR